MQFIVNKFWNSLTQKEIPLVWDFNSHSKQIRLKLFNSTLKFVSLAIFQFIMLLFPKYLHKVSCTILDCPIKLICLDNDGELLALGFNT